MPEAPVRLDRRESVLLVIDLQDKLVPVMQHPKTLMRRVLRLVGGAKALGVPIICTEQYPKGIGRTMPKLARMLEGQPAVEKLDFSACVADVSKKLGELGRPRVIVAGIEAHVCVLQTCLDLLAAGHTVALPLDATDSRRAVDRDAAVRRLIQCGVVPTSVESILFEWVGTAEGDAFQAIRRIVQEDG